MNYDFNKKARELLADICYSTAYLEEVEKALKKAYNAGFKDAKKDQKHTQEQIERNDEYIRQNPPKPSKGLGPGYD